MHLVPMALMVRLSLLSLSLLPTTRDTRKTYSPHLSCTGPFRKTCELSLGLLRQNEDALMTILETFLHDPTTDFIGKKVRFNTTSPAFSANLYICSILSISVPSVSRP